MIVYFSGPTENTHKFVQRTGLPATRIPVRGDYPRMNVPYVLVTPSYGTGKNSVPPQVKRFLSDDTNRGLLTAVVGSGNRNFGSDYGIAADKVSRKCGVPVIHKFELQGTDYDVTSINQLLDTE